MYLLSSICVLFHAWNKHFAHEIIQFIRNEILSTEPASKFSRTLIIGNGEHTNFRHTNQRDICRRIKFACSICFSLFDIRPNFTERGCVYGDPTLLNQCSNIYLEISFTFIFQTNYPIRTHDLQSTLSLRINTIFIY